MPIISVRFIDAATKINSGAPPDILQAHRLKNNARRRGDGAYSYMVFQQRRIRQVPASLAIGFLIE